MPVVGIASATDSGNSLAWVSRRSCYAGISFLLVYERHGELIIE